MSEISVMDNVAELVSRIGELAAEVEELDTPELVDAFNVVKALNGATDKFQKRAREVIIERRTEGGTNDKGHRIMAGRTTGLKVTTTTRVSVSPKAYEYLVEKLPVVADEVPKVPDLDTAVRLLETMEVDPRLYTVPTVTREFVEERVQTGDISAEHVPNLIETKETFVLR